MEDIFQIIKTINQEGITVLLVEQNANKALHIAHYGYVLKTGRVTLMDEAKSCCRTTMCGGRIWANRCGTSVDSGWVAWSAAPVRRRGPARGSGGGRVLSQRGRRGERG